MCFNGDEKFHHGAKLFMLEITNEDSDQLEEQGVTEDIQVAI